MSIESENEIVDFHLLLPEGQLWELCWEIAVPSLYQRRGRRTHRKRQKSGSKYSRTHAHTSLKNICHRLGRLLIAKLSG
jgi:hypothetical protein